MRRTTLNLRRLHYFLAVVDEGHFGRAAERLHMAQPPLSQQIKRLEVELGCKLLNRSRAGITLTEAGKVLYPEAQRLVGDAMRLADKMDNLVSGAAGTLRLGFVDSAAYAIMPRLVRSFRQAWPDVDYELHNLTSDEQVDALASGIIDVGMIRAQLHRATLRRFTVLTERFLLAVPWDHFLTARQSAFLVDIGDESLIGFSLVKSPTLYSEVATIFAQSNVPYAPAIEVANYSTVLGLVAAGHGVAVVPRSAAQSPADGLSFIELADEAAITSITMVARPEDDSLLVARAFELATTLVEAEAG